MVTLKPNDLIATSFHGNEGRLGAGSEAPRKCLESRLFNPRRRPFLLYFGHYKTGTFVLLPEKSRSPDP